MCAELFTDYRNYKIRTHSSSAGDDWEFCKFKYYAKRVLGWEERWNGAAYKFGLSVEAAAQRKLENNEIDAPAMFAEKWKEFKDAGLEYTKDEISWEHLDRAGRDLLRLFTIQMPTYPILGHHGKPQFQVKYQRELFPNSKLEGIKFTSYLDCLSFADWNHPLLKPIENPGKEFRPVIIDFKTSGKSLNLEDSQLLMLDNQLRSYAWITGVPDVGFLWFVKSGVSMDRSDNVTLLEPTAGLPGGSELLIADKQEKEDGAGLFVLPHSKPDVVSGFYEYIKGLKNKALEVKRREFVVNAGTLVPREAVTRQKIQFWSARIPNDLAEETGRVIGNQVAQIHTYAERKFFPKEGGVRYPNNKCGFCNFRGMCIGNDKLRDELLVKKDERWLEELSESPESQQKLPLVQIESTKTAA